MYKRQRLHPPPVKLSGQALRLQESAAPDAQFPVDNRRVVKDKMLCGARSPAPVNQCNRLFDQRPGQLRGVGYGGGTEDKEGRSSVKAADPLQPADHVGHVAAEDAAVLVHLVDDNKFQVLKEFHPLGMVGQDSRVEHIGIGDHDMAALPDGLALSLIHI